jgi:hypothetical protein
MPHERAAARPDEPDRDAAGLHNRGEAEVIAGGKCSQDADVQSPGCLGRRQPAQRPRRSAAAGIDAGNDVQDFDAGVLRHGGVEG